MPPPIRRQFPTPQPGLSWVVTDDGSRTLRDERLDETYHSGCGAVAETLVVYLWHSGVAERLARREPIAVLEYGFGTGMGFLLTAALAEHYRTPLHFTSLENKPVAIALLRELELASATEACLAAGQARTAHHDPGFEVAQFAGLPSLIDRLARLWESVSSGQTVLDWQFSELVHLRLLLQDASRYRAPAPRYDAVYFDPFSPESCPELWRAEVLASAVDALRSGGSLTSYCVKAEVRRRLASLGMQVTRLPGPVRGKRDVLQAVKVDPITPGI